VSAGFEWWRSHKDYRFWFIGLTADTRACFALIDVWLVEGRAVVDDFGDLVRVPS
jgi:hypothetical protein